MAYEPHFYLKKNKEDESTIYLGVQIDGKLFKYYTKYRILPELFDKQIQRASMNKSLLAEYKRNGFHDIKVTQMNINTYLDGLYENTTKIIRETLKRNEIVTKEILREELDNIYKAPKTELTNSLTFVEYLLKFIKECESGEKLYGTKKYAENTIKSYISLYNFLKGTTSNKKGKIEVGYKPNLKFDDITIEFYDELIVHLNKLERKPNTIGKYIKHIKTIMRDAFDYGYNTNQTYLHNKFKKISVKVQSFYVTQDELDRIYALDLSHNEKYETYRDFFIIGCYTALRYSDFSRIKPKYIVKKEGKNYISMKTEKTKTLVEIPIKPLVYSTLQKYNFTAPNTMNRDTMNLALKEICKMAKIDEDITYSEQIGGEHRERTIKKYSLISSKICRKTGATLLYLNDAPLLEIKSITGHSQISQLLDYISISEQEIAKRLSENPFFK